MIRNTAESAVLDLRDRVSMSTLARKLRKVGCRMDLRDRVSTSTLARKLRKVGCRTPRSGRAEPVADPDQQARQDILGIMDRVCDAGVVDSLRFAGDLCASIDDQDVVVAIAIIHHGAALAGTPIPGSNGVSEPIQRLVRHIAGPDLPACIDIACRILGHHPDPRAGMAGVVVMRAAFRARLSITDETIAAVMGPKHASLPHLYARKP